jgi:hypothetical protein
MITMLKALKIGTEFHTHLDNCKQCREQPFNLCLIGKNILNKLLKEGDNNVLHG